MAGESSVFDPIGPLAEEPGQYFTRATVWSDDQIVASFADSMATAYAPVAPAVAVTIDQAPGQVDPTSDGPIAFSVEFGAPVTGFDAEDVIIESSAPPLGGPLSALVRGSGSLYTVEISGMRFPGTVTVNIPAGAAGAADGTPSAEPTVIDNEVTFQPPPPPPPDPPPPPPQILPPPPPPIILPPPPVVLPPPVVVGQDVIGQFAVGLGFGDALVRWFNPDGSEAGSLPAFASGESPGGVRTAMADVTGDGTPDLIAGTGPGVATRVRLFDGTTGDLLHEVEPFEPSFHGGVFVAAGDVNGDGKADLVVSPDQGGGPRVRVFNGADFGQIADFFGIEDPNFRGGAPSVAALA